MRSVDMPVNRNKSGFFDEGNVSAEPGYIKISCN
jgi:hypothetical protein